MKHTAMVFSHHYENFTMDTIYISRFFSAVKIENFIGKILIYFFSKHRLWVHVRTALAIYRSGVYGGIHIIDMLFLMLCKIFKFFSDSNVTLITKH